MSTNRIETYQDFFPYYLREHRKPVTRAFHYVGTSLAIAVMLTGIAMGTWWLVLLALVAGYGPAWVGHFFFEKNKPATFDYPLWSLRGDFHMLWLFLSGRLGSRLKEAGAA